MLTFDDREHRYYYDNVEVPGVSYILKTAGLSKDFTGVDPFYKERGIAVHSAIAFYLKGTLDRDSLDPIIVPFFEGFLRYWDEHRAGIVKIEQMGYSEEYNYAGTWDLETEDMVIDWKCSKSHDRVAELQGEAYKLLVGPPFKRFRVVQLPGDGSYKVFDYGNKTDLWPSVIKIFRWRKQ